MPDLQRINCPIVVRRETLLPASTSFYSGMVLGALAIPVVFLGFLLSWIAGSWAVILSILCLGGLSGFILLRHRHRLRRVRDAFWGGCGCGTGMGTFIMPTLALESVDEQFGTACLRLGFAAVVLFVVPGLLAAALWALMTRLGRPVVLQDGTRCPICAYSLIGNTSMVCPECGQAFTLEEIGATADTLRALP